MKLHREVEDPELARFRAGLRKSFHVHYEEQIRDRRNQLTIAIVCGVGVCGYVVAVILGGS